MSLSDDTKRARDVIKNQSTRKRIEAIASKNEISFNAAMKQFFADK